MIADSDIIDDDPFGPGYDYQARARTKTAPLKRPSRSESDITNVSIGWLKTQPDTYAWKLHTAAYGESGHPDIDGCTGGRSIKIEMKRPGYRPTPQQMARLLQWREAGALVGWATSLEEVREIFAHAQERDWVNPLTGPGDGSRKSRG